MAFQAITNVGLFVRFDTFLDDSGRQAHLQGAVGSALKEKGPELLAEEPSIEPLDILAAKLPALDAAQ